MPRLGYAWVLCAVTIVNSHLSTTATADSWGAIGQREFVSEDGSYACRVIPVSDWVAQPGYCTAKLLNVSGGEETLLWSRHLINNHAPVRVYVANSGKYVVTMDEWGSVGRLAVVIYGENGRLIKAHDIETLGLAEDFAHIRMTVSGQWWNEDALVFFGPGDELIVRLHWGKTLLLDLAWGRILSQEDAGADEWLVLNRFVQQKSRDLVLTLLSSNDPLERRTGAIHAGQLRVKEAIPILRRLLADDAEYKEGWFGGTVYCVREAAEEALERMGEAPKVDQAPKLDSTKAGDQ